MAEKLIEIRDLNNKDVFTEVILKIQKQLYAVAKTRLRDENDICDAIQDTMLEAYKNVKYLKNQESFRSWMTKILINKCNYIYKKKSKYSISLEDEMYENIMDSKNNIKDFANQMDFELLIGNLSYDEKIIITLYYYNQYTTNEISYILNINENTIRSKIKRAKTKLKEHYKEEGMV